jgi:hypothetical protein
MSLQKHDLAAYRLDLAALWQMKGSDRMHKLFHANYFPPAYLLQWLWNGLFLLCQGQRKEAWTR